MNNPINQNTNPDLPINRKFSINRLTETTLWDTRPWGGRFRRGPVWSREVEGAGPENKTAEDESPLGAERRREQGEKGTAGHPSVEGGPWGYLFRRGCAKAENAFPRDGRALQTRGVELAGREIIARPVR